MTLLSDAEKLLRPDERVTCCIGCGGALGASYQMLLSGLRMCGGCVDTVAVGANWRDDEDLHESYTQGVEDGKREGIQEAQNEVADLLEPPRGARERLLKWVKS